MKCPNCGKEIYDRQFRCHYCGEIAWRPEMDEKKDKPKKEEKEK